VNVQREKREEWEWKEKRNSVWLEFKSGDHRKEHPHDTRTTRTRFRITWKSISGSHDEHMHDPVSRTWSSKKINVSTTQHSMLSPFSGDLWHACSKTTAAALVPCLSVCLHSPTTQSLRHPEEEDDDVREQKSPCVNAHVYRYVCLKCKYMTMKEWGAQGKKSLWSIKTQKIIYFLLTLSSHFTNITGFVIWRRGRDRKWENTARKSEVARKTRHPRYDRVINAQVLLLMLRRRIMETNDRLLFIHAQLNHRQCQFWRVPV
jgi:hypothetical protein